MKWQSWLPSWRSRPPTCRIWLEVLQPASKFQWHPAGLPSSYRSLKSASGAPTCTIKQLGVFAKEDLKPGEDILYETSLLTATSRLNDSFCDACSKKLPSLDLLSQDEDLLCPNCQETIFCSQRCLHLAQESYHPALCDADVSAVSKNQPGAVAADALYSLLLLRALAMSVHQDVHPLDLSEVKYIWGDYHNVHINSRNECPRDPFLGFPRTLPFSFHFNVLLPIHMLEKMDVNIFTTSNLYAPWVTNTLYSKFRGTASARQGLDGRPEVTAVHPFWCLANHSCDPSVRWEWDGSMKFWVRSERVQWLGKSKPAETGIRMGDEIMNHYCDVSLPVKERREWAVGPLGGDCRCERCMWEADQVDGLKM